MARTRRAWRLRVRPGTEEEYQRRHREIWPEMVEAIAARGMRNFSIFMDGSELFLYAETDEDAASSSDADAVGARWQAYMADILIRELDPVTGRPPILQEVFHLD